MTPEQRSMRARIAATARWAREDPTRNAIRGQQGLLNKFLAEVDAHAQEKGEVLSEAERYRRAECRRKEHMTRLRYQRTLKGGAAA